MASPADTKPVAAAADDTLTKANGDVTVQPTAEANNKGTDGVTEVATGPQNNPTESLAAPPAQPVKAEIGDGNEPKSEESAALLKPSTADNESQKTPPPQLAPIVTSAFTTEPAHVHPPAKTATTAGQGIDDVNPRDFAGEVQSNNDLPSAATLRKIENYVVLDRHGKSHTFRSLYSGRNVARRVLVIFVRHFFCGNCQEYLRTLSASITPEALLDLPIPTFIAVIGCGDPSLIDMYVSETGCRFPVYSDPTRRLYDELGMVRTLALGARPAYQRKSMISSVFSSVVQGLKQIPSGKATKAGDQRQIGGEFLFEPFNVMTPADDIEKRLGEHRDYRASMAAAKISSEDAAAGEGTGVAGGHSPPKNDEEIKAALSRSGSIAPPEAQIQQEDEAEEPGEEKHVTWAHRMRTTRDHAEIPELMEVLGLSGQGQPIKDKKRWSRALETRKGTGASLASQMSALSVSRSGSKAQSPERS
ncbi:hypothetical protein PpBr36_08200 [Pyricularia pennisetigena]|uniref:hypothetical protein n=1 Tax=Pyricularia pennisetigena TaxID=1578925 RepID=UPI001150D6AD|nr:hypothetical protein PpBr36_08200 [Pyricularia pennisetigena]TLS23806.1 hypothetical protein PpBr36_08200 [Pyricularia pennisetigena]